MLQKVWRKENIPTLLVGMKTGASSMENSMHISQKQVQIELHRIQQSHSQAYIQIKASSKRYMHSYVHRSTLHDSQDRETTICPLTDQEDVVHIHNGVLLSRNKEWNNAIFSNMDGWVVTLPNWRKTERDREIAYDITYM